MKKLAKMFAVVAAMMIACSFVSCSSDDDDDDDVSGNAAIAKEFFGSEKVSSVWVCEDEYTRDIEDDDGNVVTKDAKCVDTYTLTIYEESKKFSLYIREVENGKLVDEFMSALGTYTVSEDGNTYNFVITKVPRGYILSDEDYAAAEKKYANDEKGLYKYFSELVDVPEAEKDDYKIKDKIKGTIGNDGKMTVYGSYSHENDDEENLVFTKQ